MTNVYQQTAQRCIHRPGRPTIWRATQLPALVLCVASATAEPLYVNAPLIRLTLTHATNEKTPRLFIRSDGGSWQPCDCETAGERWLVRLPGDGRHELCARTSEVPPPNTDTRPDQLVIVDTLSPLLDVRGIARMSKHPQRLVISTVVIDEHLGPAALRIFYQADQRGSDPLESRADDSAAPQAIWHDGGAPAPAAAETIWSIPVDAAAKPLRLRLVCTDLAGNSTALDWPHLIEPVLPTAPSIAAESVLVANHTALSGRAPAARAADWTPAGPAVAASQPRLAPPLIEARRLTEFQQAASAHLAAGEWTLAAARARDALRVLPRAAEMQVLLAEALLRQGEAAAARGHLSDALANDRDFSPGWELLARLEIQAGDYRAAAAALQEFLRLRPADATGWLRLGDAEHRLGDAHTARTAWQRAASLTPSAAQRDAARRRLMLLGP